MNIKKPLRIIGTILISIGIIFIGLIFFLKTSNFMVDDWSGEPPDIKLIYNDEHIPLMQANVNWSNENDGDKMLNNNPVEAATTEIISLPVGDKVSFEIVEHDDEISNPQVSAKAWKNKDDFQTLKIQDGYVYLPEQKGEFTLSIKLKTDNGFVESVRNIIVE
jgi:hypothetical protein